MAHKIAGFGGSGSKIHLVSGTDIRNLKPACGSKVRSDVRSGAWNYADLVNADEITCAKCRAKYDAMVAASPEPTPEPDSEPLPVVAVEPVTMQDAIDKLNELDAKLGIIANVRPDLEAWKAQRGNHFLQFADINGYKLPQSHTIAPNFNLGAKKVSLPNMQKTAAKTPNTRRAMTARQLGRKLKAVTPAIPIKTWRKRHQAMQLAQLGILLGDTDNIVSIVSHIETPLTGEVRRIA